MEKCKFCGEVLPEGESVCPVCGKDNTEAVAVTEKPVGTQEEQAVQAPAEETAETPAEEAVEAPTEETAEAPAEEAVEVPAEETAEVSTEEAAETPAGETADAPTQQEQAAEQPEATPVKDGMKATPGTIALGIVALVLLVGVLVALVYTGMRGGKDSSAAVNSEPTADPNASATIEPVETTQATIPADGNPDDVTCKGSYSVSDEEAESTRDVVVATLGDKELTNAQLRVYYWMEVQGFLTNYGGYAPYMGLDYTKPLDTQRNMEGDRTWQQFFLEGALNNWRQMQALSMEGEAAGLEIAPENQQMLDNIEATLAQMAESYGVTVEELLKNNFGPGAGMDEYKYFQTQYYKGLPYFNRESEKIVPTDEILKEYFESHKEQYASGGLNEEDRFVDVRHILFPVEGGTTGEDGITTYSDEEWEACRQKAQEILDEYLAGNKTEDAFAKLATENTQDPGSAQTGGLYQRVYEGQMVPAFNDWCFDEGRKAGDTELVKTEYGYHVMYFVSSYPQWRYYAEQDWVQEQSNKIITDVLDKYDVKISYEDIALGVVDMG